MDFRKLEVFVSIVEHGNFSRAAKALFLSQPTVSSHIDNLEKDLGVSLFERTPRKAVLTARGREFFPYALQILQTAKAGLQVLQGEEEQMSGLIRLGASSTPGTYLLPYLLQPFAERNPQVSFEITLGNSDLVTQQVLNHQVDLGIVGCVNHHSSITETKVYDDCLVLAAPASFTDLKTKANDNRLSIRQVIGLPLILQRNGSATRQTLLNALESIGICYRDLLVVAEVDSLEGAKQCVRAGLGIAFLSGLSLCDAADLQLFNITDLNLQRQFYLIHKKNRPLSAKERKLCAHLAAGGR